MRILTFDHKNDRPLTKQEIQSIIQTLNIEKTSILKSGALSEQLCLLYKGKYLIKVSDISKFDDPFLNEFAQVTFVGDIREPYTVQIRELHELLRILTN